MFIIYKITNTVNQKVYIGQTSKSIQERFKQHCSKWSYCVKLKNAINKYGKDNFNIKEIDHAHTQEEANNKEIFYIEFYKSQNKTYGYNLAGGAYSSNPTTRKKLICLETNKMYDSVTDCAKEFNTSVKNISRVCRGHRPTFAGKHFAYLDENNQPITNIINFKAKKAKRKVKCIETNEIFESIKVASDKLGFTRFAVGYACKNNKHTCGGYHWKYVNEGEY